MKIEYDSDKAAANPINHEGVTFEEAKHVLLDPYALTCEACRCCRRAAFCIAGHGWERSYFSRGVDVTRRLCAPDFRMESQPTAEETL